MSQSSKLSVACLQMSSVACVDENLKFIERELNHAQPIDVLVLPENFAQMPERSSNQFVEAFEGRAADRRVQMFLLEIATRFDLHIVAGSMPIRIHGVERPFARCLIVGPSGVLAYYDKVHLFDVDVQASTGTQRYRESGTYQSGSISLHNISTHKLSIGVNTVRLGASICYDLRFPELYGRFAVQGANIITVPAAFTFDTGEAHWETLLRARAIENQAFVVAAAQVGRHASGRRTWGHSMIIDPWGKILACKETDLGLLYADLDLNEVDTLKQGFPVLAHKRLD